jgi:ATP-dependent exoDNAse (exonuclease V) alpha subunit
MIANRGRGRMVGASRFGDAIGYIVREGPNQKREHEPPLAVWSGYVSSIETAAFEMEATASQSRASEPLYHLIISWDDHEQPNYEQARAALDAQIKHLGFEGLQYVAALQNDGVSGHYHVHAVINRVDPVTHVAVEVWQDRERMRAACREAEIEGGWRSRETVDERKLSHGARDVEYFKKHRSFERYVREEIGLQLREALSKENPTWADVHRVMTAHDARYEVVHRPGRDGNLGPVQGGRVVGRETGEYARARDLGEDLTHRKLEARLGPYEHDKHTQQARDVFAERCSAAALDLAELRRSDGEKSWEHAHAVFEKHGIEYQRYRSGGRVIELDGPATAKPSDIDRGLAYKAMCERFGAYETSAAIADRQAAREAVQHAEQLVLGAQLINDPSALLERLTANNATFTLHQAEKLVHEKLNDPQQRQQLLEKIVAESVELQDEHGKSRLTTQAVLDAEKRLLQAVEGLATSRPDVGVTQVPSERLDEQQRAAYGYAIADDARLKVITGVPGAGKTTLINEVSAAYQNAGYSVRAVSIANSAVDVLRRETSVPSQSVAKELYEWGQGRGQLGSRDVLIIDEVSTLGTKQGAELLQAAHEGGAVVIALGDDKQFQAVAHGNALTAMQRSVGDTAIDLEKTRRQSEAWQREATQAIRRGDVREAIDAYQARGFVHRFVSQDAARGAIVARWAEIERSGSECGIETFTNVERVAVNTLAREEWRAMGRLQGEDVRLDTVDGSTPYAIGDRVVVRETIKEAGLFNGSVGTVRGIENGVLSIERRDGELVKVDTREHPGIQHGYCSTEYREQGSTRYAELQLVTKHVNQRSLTVGMTRHTDQYGMYYARETVGSYNDLVKLGERTKSKELASDFTVLERGQQRAQPRELSVTALKWELESIARGEVAGYSREERKEAFRTLNTLERLEPNHKLSVDQDLHKELKAPENLHKQIEHGRKEQQREWEVSREQEIDRGYGHSMGFGR